ncbi:MAG TPA: serine hydrolase domain-containing protein, partial [Cytophagaceae bacterium]
MSHKLYLIPLFILLLNFKGSAQTIKKKKAMVENSLFEVPSSDSTKRYNIVDRMRFHKAPSISLAVINGGKIEWSEAYGYADVKENRLATVKTLYQVASISKTINAFYIMMLWQQGKISLDEDIRSFLRTWKIEEN